MTSKCAHRRDSSAADASSPERAASTEGPRVHAADILCGHHFIRSNFAARGTPEGASRELAAVAVTAGLLATDHGRRAAPSASARLQWSAFEGTAEEFVDEFVALACAEVSEDAFTRQLDIVRRLVGLTPAPTRKPEGQSFAFVPESAAFSRHL